MTPPKANHLRAPLGTDRLLAGIGARDALDARLIEDAQFDFVWAGSCCISAANCVPDSSILSMTQFLEAARIEEMFSLQKDSARLEMAKEA